MRVLRDEGIEEEQGFGVEFSSAKLWESGVYAVELEIGLGMKAILCEGIF